MSIEKRAYYLWIEAGCPESDGVEFWLQAEQERETSRTSQPAVEVPETLEENWPTEVAR